jgi:hypothetical protein
MLTVTPALPGGGSSRRRAGGSWRIRSTSNRRPNYTDACRTRKKDELSLARGVLTKGALPDWKETAASAAESDEDDGCDDQLAMIDKIVDEFERESEQQASR